MVVSSSELGGVLDLRNWDFLLKGFKVGNPKHLIKGFAVVDWVR